LSALARGAIFAHGSRFGGHRLFIKEMKLHYVYNLLGIKLDQAFVSDKLAPGNMRSAWSSSARRAANTAGRANSPSRATVCVFAATAVMR
jgi:hypothetical protein